MTVKTVSIKIESKPEMDVIDITDQVSEIVKNSGIKDGIVTIFVPGSTAGVSTIEYEPNLVEDLERIMERIAPSDMEYKHKETWGDDNGKSHVRATLVGPSLTIPFKNGKLFLGTWQQVVIMDFDVPARRREIILQIIGE